MNSTSFGEDYEEVTRDTFGASGGDEHVFSMVLGNDTNSLSSGPLEDILKGHNNGSSAYENIEEPTLNDLNWWALLTFIVPLLAVFGNLLVILAVRNEPRLQTRTNSFLLSLAVCDSLVALLVIPPSCLQLITGNWSLGGAVGCLIWLFLDVLFCTASILHLATLSVDRYLSLRFPWRFGREKSRSRLLLTIIFVWFASVSLALFLPISLCMKHANVGETVLMEGNCVIPDPAYRVWASLVCFYLPLLAMVATYALTVRLLQKHPVRMPERNYSIPLKRRITRGNDESHFPASSQEVFGHQVSTETDSSTYSCDMCEENSGRLKRKRTANWKCRSGGGDGNGAATGLLVQGHTSNHHSSGDLSNHHVLGHHQCPIFHPSATSSLNSNSNSLNRLLNTNTPLAQRLSAGSGGGGSTTSGIPGPPGINNVNVTNAAATGATAGNNLEPPNSIKQVISNSILKLSSSASSSPKNLSKVKHKTEVISLASFDYQMPSSRNTTSGGTTVKYWEGDENVSRASWRLLARLSKNASNRRILRSERKATKVLGIVFFAFVGLWLPFFALNVTAALLADNPGKHWFLSDQVMETATWIGWTSSLINPFLYTAFNRDFRTAFGRLLRCRCQKQQPTVRL